MFTAYSIVLAAVLGLAACHQKMSKLPVLAMSSSPRHIHIDPATSEMRRKNNFKASLTPFMLVMLRSTVLGLAACHPTANSWFLAAVLGLAACHPNSEQGAGEGRTFGPPFLKMLGVSVCFCVGKAGYYFEHSGKLRLLAQQQMGVSRVFLIALKDTSIAGRWPLAWQWRSPECF